MGEEPRVIQVWLVEDNAPFRRGMARAIATTEGMECGRQFASAEALVAALRGPGQPDVILLDVQLPGIDGIAVLADVRSLAPAARAVILTAFDDPQKIFRALCAGASGYILKSADKRAVGEAVREVVSGGAPMTPSVARKVLERFAAEGEGSRGRQEDYRLTDREREILRLMADGLIKKEISAALEISVHTVNTHMRSIYEKLHVNTNTGAVAKALREDLI